jgi:hypothetical protein
MEVRMQDRTIHARATRTIRATGGIAALALAVASLLWASACTSPHEGSRAAAVRDAVVDTAADAGLELGPRRREISASAMGSGKHDAEKELDALAGGSHSQHGKIPPSPDDWRIITNSLGLFRHAPYVTDLVLGLGCSVLVALALTSTPRRGARFDPVSRAEQRRATVVCALIGCIAAELVQASEQFLLGAEIALVLFGIGGLVRFRTLFDDAGQTGVAIVATVLGLACGMSEYSLVALSLAVVFLITWWMSSIAFVQVRVKVRKNTDLAQVQAAVTSILQERGFAMLRESPDLVERTLEVHARTGGEFDSDALARAIQDAVPGARVRVKAA